ncbi:HAD family hydrolase [Cellulomonas sp. P24]|uniref:HAD family hydrolase n=1 Tax=Cellulomonas sp. P24 TaxID=2885206 RepID=UPI00216B5EB8|nr:HAD family hydrolase [Cellulomonas sp. P24]MCR6494403.1 HAD family hydrolase [Cellulomonas sp. P24]
MALQALVFDVDGTLADTERDGHRPAFNAAFAHAGLPWHWDVALYGGLLGVTGGKERIRHFCERHDRDFLSRPDADDAIAALHADKTRRYVAFASAGRVRLRPGVARLLTEAREAGMRLAVATTTSPENVTALLEVGLGPDGPGWFEVIGAGDVVPRKKPAPDIYLWVVERLRLRPDECLAIEDSSVGLHAAVTAGLPTVVTRSPYTVGDDMTGALAVLPDLTGVTLADLTALHDTRQPVTDHPGTPARPGPPH